MPIGPEDRAYTEGAIYHAVATIGANLDRLSQLDFVLLNTNVFSIAQNLTNTHISFF